MSVKLGLVAFLEAKPEKAEELGALLQQGRIPTSARSTSSP